MPQHTGKVALRIAYINEKYDCRRVCVCMFVDTHAYTHRGMHPSMRPCIHQPPYLALHSLAFMTVRTGRRSAGITVHSAGQGSIAFHNMNSQTMRACKRVYVHIISDSL